MTAGIRKAAVALAAMGAVGLPATYFLAQAMLGEADREWDGPSMVLCATIAGAWVWAAALVGLAPLWMARQAAPAQQVNARLGHVLIRLLLTAGGLIAFLLYLPEENRLTIGLFALGWYALTWVIDFGLLRMNAAQAAT
ncbi:MAG: hypothetical protein AAGA25_11950 [Planctomycetota bacterium]